MITLNRDHVVAKAREAYETKRLSAQGPTPKCRYRDPSGRACVIGAALTDAEIASLPAMIESDDGGAFLITLGTPIGTLIRRKVVKTDAREFLRELQHAHDQWVQGQASGERDLRRLLGIDQ